jgi:drug/metabolite transporter (DMT)-like permease
MGLDLAGNRLALTVQSNAVTDPNDRAAILTEFSVILAAIFWGTNFAATKFAALSIPPLLLVAFRFCAGGLLMYGVLRLLEPESRLGGKDLFPMAALGCLGVGTAQTGFTFGLSMTSAASTGLIFSTAPVWGMLLGSVLGHERPTGRGVVGVALSIVGVEVVFYEGLGAGSTSLIGNLWVLLAAVSVGVYHSALRAALGTPHALDGCDLPDPLRRPVRAALVVS